MNTTKLIQKWLPVAFAAAPLILNLVQNLWQSVGSTPVPASVEAPHLWHLIDDGQKAMAKHSWLVSLTLGAFLYTLTTLATRSEEMLQILLRPPSSNISFLAGAHEGFGHLIQAIKDAKRGIYLMYLRPDPVYDQATREYWATTTRLFVKKKVGNLPIWRIASLDQLEKLNFLLQNNSQLFSEGGSEIRDIEYELRALPSNRIKPLRIDVIDGTAFMFKTYDRDKKQIMVTEEKIVAGCLEYYNEVWNDLGEWTIMATSRAKPLKPAPGRTAYGYSEPQVRVIARVIREVLKEEASEETFNHIKPHCELSWDDFRKLCAAAPSAPG